jgi:hypothetical protein
VDGYPSFIIATTIRTPATRVLITPTPSVSVTKTARTPAGATTVIAAAVTAGATAEPAEALAGVDLPPVATLAAVELSTNNQPPDFKASSIHGFGRYPAGAFTFSPQIACQAPCFRNPQKNNEIDTKKSADLFPSPSYTGSSRNSTLKPFSPYR